MKIKGTKWVMPRGVGEAAEGKACVMACVNMIEKLQAGETDIFGLSDHTSCVDNGIRVFMIGLNDYYNYASDEERTALLSPYIAKIMGTATDGHHEERLRIMKADPRFHGARGQWRWPGDRCTAFEMLDRLLAIE